MNAFETWVWRRMERVSWKDKKTNEEVLKLVGKNRSLLTTIVIRRKTRLVTYYEDLETLTA